VDDEKILDEIEGEKDPEGALNGSLHNQIQLMSVSEMVQLGTLGNKEARNILIKNPNRIIVQAVLNSPKITDEEVILFAGNKNLSKEVSVTISNKKEFIKNYRVKVALLNNPKTPLPTAIKFLRHLLPKDLRSIAKSKNVPTVLAKTAIKILENKGR
jgi:hypothetical protein